MLKFVLGLIAGPLLLGLLIWAYCRLGYAPVATSAPPLPFERQLTHMALHKRADREAPAPANTPLHPTEEDLAGGARTYRKLCAICHGTRDGSKTPIAKGMFPEPPLLLHGKGVTDDTPGETWWKVKNGIRLTGMPAFVGTLSDNELWQVSLLVAGADKLPPSVLAILDSPE